VNIARALRVSPDGTKVFVTGRNYRPRDAHATFATLAYDAATGAQLWVRNWDGGTGYAEPVALGVSPDGSKVFVTGRAVATSSDYGTVAYDAATGGRLWVKLYDGQGAYDEAHALGVSADGSKVVVTGRSDGAHNSHYATVAYEAATGTKVWGRRYSASQTGSDSASALGVSPDGSTLYVTGYSWSGTSDDYATVAYNADSGDVLWVARYDGPASSSDIPSALAVSPDGSKLFVTGQSWSGSEGAYDYATVAYSSG
jgi:DNA-binding beta-propeller fold protein YncE